MALSIEKDRALRALKRGITKRNDIVNEMNILHNLSLSVQINKDDIPIFIERKKDIDKYVSNFNLENDLILDQLIELERDEEYTKQHVPIKKIFMEQYYFILSISSKLSLCEPVHSISVSTCSQIQLPKILLPTFDGNILQWRSFRDTFISLVHDNQSLSKVEKFHYLLSSVTGMAASYVRSLPLTDDNYTIVWDNLHIQYDNKRVLLNAHLDVIFRFEPMTTESLSNLKKFVNIFQENISCIKALKVNDLEGFLLFYIASRVLDPTTKRLFESEYHNVDTPTLDLLIKFVQTRCQVLINSEATTVQPLSKSKQLLSNKVKMFKSSLITNSNINKNTCTLCQGNHFLYQCRNFTQNNVQQRFDFAKSKRLCMNCLSSLHKTSECTSKHTCNECSGKHHSLLHFKQRIARVVTSTNSSSPPVTSQVNASSSTPDSVESDKPFVGTFQSDGNVILGTAIIHVCNNIGHWIPVRALLDTGSQISVITHACASRLGLKRRQCHTSVTGLSQSCVPSTKGSTSLVFKPAHTEKPKIFCEPLILSKITGFMPTLKLNPIIRKVYKRIKFADPEFDIPAPIDFLLGADVYSNILIDGSRILHSQGIPSSFETIFGWVIIGQSTVSDISTGVSLCLSTESSIDHLLNRFWSVEEPCPPTVLFTDEEKCEEHFLRTTVRDENGRFVVSLPFRDDPLNLGDSYATAKSRFYNLEHKLQRDPEVYAQYCDFMEEYENLGHMTIAQRPGKYYIPHHVILKRSESQIKLRVVFDASAPTTSKRSLNDILYIGPKLQTDISQLLHRCRFNKYMFTADICKMYRQIKINTEDRQYQHILWRKNPFEELRDYELTTVTYGVSSSPYQAIRVLHQLEKDNGPQFKFADNILTTQTYVDDIVSGADTISALLLRQENLIQLLKQGGFELKKWSSNCGEALIRIPQEDHALHSSFDPKDDMSIKILGLHWDPVHDTFGYHTSTVSKTITKRVVLSTIAKLYDPIGALAPITFWAKSFMQLIWKLGINWDDSLPSTLINSWLKFSSELPLVSQVKIPRYILTSKSSIQLIGFCDASEKGYASVVYLRTVDIHGHISVHFVTSKSKVAPLKFGKLENSLSIPRLELCGALLLAQTIHQLLITFKNYLPITSIYVWTDSQVVLSWITSSPSQFKIFVTNRLAKISTLLPTCQWNYVPSASNPADCVSRGLFPSQAIDHILYWQGPRFLLQSESDWSKIPCDLIPLHQLPDFKKIDLRVCNVTSLEKVEWFNRFSSLTRLQRVTAYVLRFIQRTKRSNMSTDSLNRIELNQALIPIIISIQLVSFKDLLMELRSKEPKISSRSLAQLAPFIDSTGIIRVGGRLRNSNASFSVQHPILLPKSSHFTTLVIRHYHLTYFHAGPQLTASLIARSYWIISSRSAIRHLIFKCVICARHKPKAPQPFMSHLPSQRVRPSRPFSHVGIDFAGPFLIKESRRKNSRSNKCYLAVFICMAVKAVHLEIVSDLSTDAFIAALHRFVSRRGIPANIYTDCGTNFKGADKQLQQFFNKSSAQPALIAAFQCQWHFNPPGAPHFGGLWEAAVKSVKFHLKRVVNVQALTFEELSTLANRIEAILNSRPITALSTDPNDFRSLSPGDFIIGEPLVAIPEPDITNIPNNKLNRWELLRQMHQSFWKRWSSEYLNTLQCRSKWFRQKPNVKIGDLVLVQTPNQPPMNWKLGRIEDTHPGQDGVVRVATIRTTDGLIKRPVVKLAVLPIDDNPST